MRNTRVLFALGLFFMFFGAARLSYAHKVNLFAYVEGNIVYTESYFPDGRPVENGMIEVFDSQKKLLVSGKTDKEGLFSFSLPKLDDLTIVINATMGHKNSYLLKKTEMK